MDCSSPHSVLEALLATRPESLLEWRGSYPYPQVQFVLQSSELFCDSVCFLVKSIHFHKIMFVPLSLQNLLRNAAKSGCQTNYTYIPDIDMVPTPTMDLQLEQFLATPEVPFCCSPHHHSDHCPTLLGSGYTQYPTLAMFTCLKVRECGMCAYVVPTYEIAQDSPR